MKVKALPTVERITELLAFNERTGIFTWRVNVHPRGKAGNVAGAINFGYRIISIDGRRYRAARLAFKVFHGRDPIGEIDHRNCIGTDDRPENLREATSAQNKHNVPVRKNNRVGLKGVCRTKHKSRPWCAVIGMNGKNRYLGQFLTPEAAHAAYRKAAFELHGAFARFDSSASTSQKQPDAAVIGRESRVAGGDTGASERE